MRSSKSLKSASQYSDFKSQSDRTQNAYFPNQPSVPRINFISNPSNLQSEIANALLHLKKIQSEIKQDTKKTNYKKKQYSVDDLFRMQNKLKTKDREIKGLIASIKQMKLFKRKQQKVLKVRLKARDGYSQNKISLGPNQEQIRLLKKTLQSFQSIFEQKQRQHQKKRQFVNMLQTKYKLNCKNKGLQALSSSQYSQIHSQKQSISTDSKISLLNRKPQNMTVKEIISSTYNGQNLQHTQDNLVQLRTRKQILQGSLKSTKRRHQKEIEELKELLEALSQQKQTLKTKLYQKNRQKQMIEQNKKY